MSKPKRYFIGNYETRRVLDNYDTKKDAVKALNNLRIAGWDKLVVTDRTETHYDEFSWWS